MHVPCAAPANHPVLPPEPVANSRAARLGDWILSRLENRSPGGDARWFTPAAISEGLQTAVGRVVLMILVPVCCWTLAFLCAQIADSMGSWNGPRSIPEYGELRHWLSGIVSSSAIVVAILSTIACMVLCLAETENKWAWLSWGAFVCTAAGALSLASAKMSVCVLLAPQFYLHWSMHRGLELRRQRAEWERLCGRLSAGTAGSAFRA